MCIIFTYRKHTHCTYLFTKKVSIIFLVYFQSLNRFLNTLYGNGFYWGLKIYTDFLEIPRNIYYMSYLQNAVRAVFTSEQEQEKIDTLLGVL